MLIKNCAKNKNGKASTAAIAIIVAAVVIVIAAVIILFALPAKKNVSDVQKSTEDASASSVSLAEETTEEETNYISTGNEQVVADGDVKITYLSLSEGVVTGDKYVDFKIENNTSHGVSVGLQNFEANGYNMTYLDFAELENGESKEATFSISAEQLEESNIDEINSVLVGFKIYNSDDSSEYNITDKATIVINEDAETAEENTENFQLLKESDNVSVYFKEFKKYNDEKCGFIFYIENNSDKDVNVKSGTLKVNGTEVSTSIHGWCDANSKLYTELTLDKEFLDAYNIDSVENIDFDLVCQNILTDETIWKSESLTLNAE